MDPLVSWEKHSVWSEFSSSETSEADIEVLKRRSLNCHYRFTIFIRRISTPSVV